MHNIVELFAQILTHRKTLKPKLTVYELFNILATNNKNDKGL